MGGRTGMLLLSITGQSTVPQEIINTPAKASISLRLVGDGARFCAVLVGSSPHSNLTLKSGDPLTGDTFLFVALKLTLS